MKRRELLLATGALLAAPMTGAQQAEKVYQVGILSIGSNPAGEARWQPFIEAMRALNYVEGRNLVIKRGFCDGRAERLPGLVADLVGAKLDIIVATGDRELIGPDDARTLRPLQAAAAPGSAGGC